MVKNKENLFGIVLLLLLSLIFSVIPQGANKLLIWFCLIYFYVIFFNSISKPIAIVKGVKTFIKIDTFLFLSFYLIFYYPYQLYVLGVGSLDSVKFLSYEQYTNKAILLSTIALLAFQLGFNYYRENQTQKILHVISKKYMNILTFIIFLFISLILLLFVNTGASTLFSGAYIGSKMGSVTFDAIFSLVTFFIILGLLQSISYYSIHRKINVLTFIISIISIVWAGALLFVGDRNTFFLVGLVIASGIFTYIKSVSRLTLLVLSFLSLLLYQVIEISRISETKDLDSLLNAASMVINGQGEENGKKSSLNTTTIGLRATFKIMEEQDFYYGKFKLVSIASIVPYSSRLFVDSNDEITGSSNVLKKEMIGLEKTWGVGTNIISDAYFDFGLMGVLIIMFYFGRFGGYVKLMTQKHINSPKWMYIYIITLSYYTEIVRYGFGFPLRSIIWTFLLFFVINTVAGLASKNSKYKINNE
jgi:hypothetical protein